MGTTAATQTGYPIELFVIGFQYRLEGRELRGLSSAKFTFIFLPSSSVPSIWPIAFCAASSVPNVTKPNPRERPVSRSLMTRASSISPNCSNAARSASLSVFQLKPPINNLFPTDFSLYTGFPPALHFLRLPNWKHMTHDPRIILNPLFRS